ncbi:MAG: hypoxanthine phosphoribosyltransferase [Bacteroidales bacterium]|nr:hypoxanthine phosphoribosyltransferase [Bacteroidales bacterium]
MKEIITIKDKSFIKFISKEEISAAVDRIAAKINEEYKDEIPVILVTLNGAILFAAELIQKLTIDCVVSAVKMSSYHGTMQSSAHVKSLVGLSEDVKDKRVLIIEDIIDTGNTYEHMVELLNENQAKDVAIATMTFKPTAYTKSIPVQYVGIEIPDKFIVGHGLDYQGLGRNVPDIYQLYKEEK